MLNDLNIKYTYRTNHCDFDKDFMIPCLSHSCLFDRGSGFFTMSSLVRSIDGIEKFLDNGGKLRLICSPELSQQDIDIIQAGLTDKDAVDKLLQEIKKEQPAINTAKLDIICNMIHEGRLEIKVAFMPIGIYHEKFGIFTDLLGHKVSYIGSNNETWASKECNYESFSTDLSWEGKRDEEKIKDHEEHFHDLWNNEEEALIVIDFPEVVKECLFEKYKKSSSLLQALSRYKKEKNSKQLYPFQRKAIEQFVENGFVHFYEMATGTGKTFTAIRSITELMKHVVRPRFVVICVPQIDLQMQWLNALKEDGYEDVLLFGGEGGGNTDRAISEAIIMNSMGDDVICVAVYDTFFSKVSRRLTNIENLFLIVDEAHNLTPAQIAKLPSNVPYRLGLSATIQRFSESETKSIVKYFTADGVSPFYYGIEEAIENKFLSHYMYYPIIVEMTEDEFYDYQRKTLQIAAEMAKDENERDEDALNRYRTERSLIVKKASRKLDKLRQLTQDGHNFVNSVVYCGQGKQEEEPIIDAVTSLLNEAKLSVHTFTSKTIDRPKVLHYFETGYFDTLVAIKCFDEGVDVPKLDKIYIMASDTALRQTVQRRGRVLRQCKATGKSMAYIYDMIVMPPYGYYLETGVKSLVVNEFRRGREYNRLSSNKEDNDILIQNYFKKYEITEDDLNYEND